jgi:hypothetical protein
MGPGGTFIFEEENRPDLSNLPAISHIRRERRRLLEVVKLFRQPLTAPRQFGILQTGPG